MKRAAGSKVTVLLAKMYADLEVARRGNVLARDMPQNISELILAYLNRINSLPGTQQLLSNMELHVAAQQVAWACVRRTFKPGMADRPTIAKLLGEKGNASLDYLEQRLGLIHAVGLAREQVRFALDPLAEQLAAMHLAGLCGTDDGPWRKQLAAFDAAEGGLSDIAGFMKALRNCCEDMLVSKSVPAWLPDELENRIPKSRVELAAQLLPGNSLRELRGAKAQAQ